ncbi:MAG TPA: CAP domain-containing protein, partial [Verrucomicrobiae bacterium]|nr:CAP domain-containing protein [Verrucomicrobiae bacterium]
MSLSLKALLASVIFLFVASVAHVEAAPFLFSIGDPTDDEQLYLEQLNRARANAPAEAQRLIALDDVYVQNALRNVNTNLMVQQFSTNPAAMPLSFNAQLINAARAHAQYQFNNGIQSHIGPGTNTLAQRLQSAGYPYFWATENVYSYAQSAVHGHAAFEVDWTGDNSNGGMQSPPAHRDHNHDRRFVEIGIGVINGTNKVGTNVMVGPQLVTQDFGTTSPGTTYITGVAYYDLNGNNFYDLGEGLSGVTVTVDGVDAYALTASSGGYSIPVAANQNYTVRFNPAGAPQVVNAVSVASTNNVKLDFKPTFTPSAVSSAPTTTYAGISNLFTFSTLPGATAYRTRIFPLRTMPLEGAEGALTNVSLTTYGGYATLSSTV